MSPHSSGHAPFTVLVTGLQKASRSQGFIRIDPSTFKMLKEASQPLEDSSLRDAIELLEAANKQNCLRLEPASFSCVVWAAFRLQPSLLQLRLLHVLSSSYGMLKDETKAIVYFDNLMGAGKVDMRALRSRRKDASQQLVKILFALLHDARKGGLRIQAADFLFAMVHADIDAKRVVYDGPEMWRESLGSIIHNSSGDYVLRVFAANLVRELLVGRFDRHLFWPRATPSASEVAFPLADFGDSRWLFDFAAYASDLDVNRAFHGNELPEVVPAQGLEVDSVTLTEMPLLAILSSAITFIWPSEDRTYLHRLEVPLVDAMEIQQEEDHISVHYRRSSGYKICQGARSELRNLRLRVEDAAHGLHDSTLIADKLSASEKEKIKIGQNSSHRSAYASVDLSQSSPSTVSLVDEADAGVGGVRATGRIRQQHPNSEILPSASRPKDFSKNDGIEAYPPSRYNGTNLIDIASQAVTTPVRKSSCAPRAKPTLDEDHSVILKHKSIAMSKSTAMMPQQNTQARKRQSEKVKSKTQSQSRVDWDEGLRAETADSDVRPQKKAKTQSKPVSKPAAATSTQPEKSTTKKAEAARDAMSKATLTVQAKDTSKSTVATTRARRGPAKRPIHYAQDNDLDADEDDDAAEQEDSLLVRGSRPNEASKNDAVTARPGKNTKRVEVSDSQASAQIPRAASQAGEDIERKIHEMSGFVPPPSNGIEPQLQPEESADDSHLSDRATHIQVLEENDRSFGSALKDALGLSSIETIPTNKPSTERAFGNTKNFLQDVNSNKSTSPQETLPQQGSRAPQTDNVVSPHRPDRVSTASRVEQQAQTKVATKPLSSQHSQIRQKQSTVREPSNHEESKPISKDLDPMNRPESADEGGILGDDAGSTVVSPAGPESHVTPAATTNLTCENVAPAAAHETTMEVIPRDKILGQTNRPSARKVTFTEVRSTTRTLVEEEKEIARQRRPRTAHPKTAAKTRQSGGSVEKSSVGPNTPVVSREQFSKQERTRNPRDDTTTSIRLIPDNASVVGDESSMMIDDRMHRKTQLVSFGANGPKNQGTLASSKSISTRKASNTVPSETQKHLDYKKQPVRRPSPMPLELSVLSDATLQQVPSMEISDSFHEDHGIAVQEAVTVPVVCRSSKGRNASQGSIVDQNGSPRLHAPHEPRQPLPSIEESSSELVEEAESSFDVSEELEGSEYTESSPLKPKAVAANAVNEKAASTELVQPKQAKMVQTRESIGLNEQLIQNFPQAKRSIVTKAFKTQVEPAIGRPPVVVEKPNQTASQPTPVREEPVAKIQQTIVTRLPPKAPIEEPRPVVRSISKTPASFNTRMPEKMMLPPPVPQKQRQDAGNIHAQGSKDKIVRQSSVTQDADETLVGVEDSDETQEQRAPPPRRRQPSPNSSSSSDSEYEDPRRDVQHKELFGGDDGGMWNGQRRQTQQAMQAMQALLNECANLVVFRMASAESAVAVKIHDYHVGSVNVINTFQSSFDSSIEFHVKKGSPQVGGLCRKYRSTIEQATESARRVHQGCSMDDLETAIRKRPSGIICRIQGALDASGT